MKEYIAFGIPAGNFLSPIASKFVRPLGIKLGGRFVELTSEECQVWYRLQRSVSAQELEQYGEDFKIVDALEIGGKLVENGLAFSFDVGEAIPYGTEWNYRISGFELEKLRHIRVLPAGLSLGNSVDRKDDFVVADMKGDPQITLNVVDYLLWESFDGITSLHEAYTSLLKKLKFLKNKLCKDSFCCYRLY